METGKLKKTGGDLMKIAEIQSGPVIVRGRSPRNFDSKKDVPLSGEKKSQSAGPESRSGSDGNIPANLKSERTDLSQNLHRYHSLGNVVHAQPGSNEWPGASPTTPAYNQQQHPAKRTAISPPVSRPPIPTWNKDSSPNKTPTIGSHPSKNTPSVPINLSLSEDERSPNNRAGSDAMQSPSMSRASTGPGRVGSPVEEADMLYEYFPLSVDDW